MEEVSRRKAMKRYGEVSRSLENSDGAMTAVIEFLTAFVLFLIILTAFFSLAGLQLGSNHPKSDQLDTFAHLALDRLTEDQGYFTPLDSEGDRDPGNSTTEWHVLNATWLNSGFVHVGLSGQYGALDQARVDALANVTEDKFIRGLGLPGWCSVNLTIAIEESDDENRVGLKIFQDGASRNAAGNSALAHRTMVLGNEIVTVVLEVHDAGRTPSDLRITEFMVKPELGYPEWVELENSPGFAANMSGYGLGRDSSGGVHALIGDGALAGGDAMICSGKPALQANNGADLLLDCGMTGVLGRGAIDGLNEFNDALILTWTYPGTAQTVVEQRIDWDDDWDISTNQALNWNGNSTSSDSNGWDRVDGGTPGVV